MLMNVLSSALKGISIGICPIGFVVVAALFAYQLCEKTGAMEKIRAALKGVSSDPIVVTLLVVWGFGNFMEGMAGFGTAVAIPAAILVGFGVDALKAVVLCLIANTCATGFGAVGVPMVTLAKATGLDLAELSFISSIPLALVALPTPFLLVACQAGWRKVPRYVPICLIAGLSFALPTVLIAKTMGAELPTIVNGIVTMLAIILFAPKSVETEAPKVPARELLVAAAPFISVVVLLSVYALALPKAIKASITPGAVILVAAMIGGFVQKVSLKVMGEVAIATLRKAKRALITICTILAIAKILETLGVITYLAALVVALLGKGYTFAATLVGVLGGAITGSGTSTCVIFGVLQRDAALEIGVNPMYLAAANILGAGIGKMICPQSIAIGLAAVGLLGAEGKVVKGVLPWFIGVVLFATTLVGLLSSL